jgi:hypothetical protein
LHIIIKDHRKYFSCISKHAENLKFCLIRIYLFYFLFRLFIHVLIKISHLKKRFERFWIVSIWVNHHRENKACFDWSFVMWILNNMKWIFCWVLFLWLCTITKYSRLVLMIPRSVWNFSVSNKLDKLIPWLTLILNFWNILINNFISSYLLIAFWFKNFMV